MRLISALVFLQLSTVVQGANVTLEFDVDQILGLNGYSESGFSFSVDQPAFVGAFGDSALLGTEGPGVSTAVLSQSESLPFDLLSFDVWNLQNVYMEAELVGTYLGGGYVQTTISASADWDALLFNDDWTGLVSLAITVDNTAAPSQLMIDNIALTTVPVPAAAWLFGSALVGLGWLRRNQTI